MEPINIIDLLKEGGEGKIYLAEDAVGKKIVIKRLNLENTEAKFVTEVIL